MKEDYRLKVSVQIFKRLVRDDKLVKYVLSLLRYPALTVPMFHNNFSGSLSSDTRDVDDYK